MKILYSSTTGNINIKIYNATNNTLINEQNIALGTDALINPSMFTLQVYRPGSDSAYGYFDNILISDIPTNTQSSISFDLASYVLNQIGVVTYTISNNDWSWIYSYDVVISKNDVEMKRISNVAQTGIAYYPFESTGGYTVSLKKMLLGIQIVELSFDSAGVFKIDGYIYVRPDILTNRNFNVTYNAGYVVTEGMVITKHLEVDNSYTIEKTYLFFNSASGTYLSTVAKEGVYVFELRDASNTLLASVTSNSVYAPFVATINLSKSFVNTTKNTYTKGEIITGDYGISSFNYTNYTSFSLQYYSIIDDMRYTSQAVQEQTGEFQTYMTNARAGENRLFLSAFDSTGHNVTLASCMVNFSQVNLFGYGLSVSKNTVLKGEKFYVNIITPAKVFLDIKNEDTGKSIFNRTFNGSTNIEYIINTVGYYQISLIDELGSVQAVSGIDVVSQAVVQPTATTAQGLEGGTATTLSIIGSTWLWAAILMIGFAIAGGAVAGAVGLVAGFSMGVVFSFIGGLIPAWAMFLFGAVIFICVSVIIAGAYTKTGGGD